MTLTLPAGESRTLSAFFDLENGAEGLIDGGRGGRRAVGVIQSKRSEGRPDTPP